MTTLGEVRRAGIPESWDCIDCGMNTAPGIHNAAQFAEVFAMAREAYPMFDERCEVYTVKPAVWKAARMTYDGGCLCVGCLEGRLGRRLRPHDFLNDNGLNLMPGTDRLLSRRMGMSLTEAEAA
jgi:hypothetical protein